MDNILLAAICAVFLGFFPDPSVSIPPYTGGECSCGESDCNVGDVNNTLCVDLCNNWDGCNYFYWSSNYYNYCLLTNDENYIIDNGLSVGFLCGEDGQGCVKGNCGDETVNTSSEITAATPTVETATASTGASAYTSTVIPL